MDEGHSELPNDPNEIMINPKKFGFPTFEDFKKNPSKYKLSPTVLLDKVDEGQNLLKNISSHRYKIKSRSGMVYDCKDSIDTLAYIAGQEGIPLKMLKILDVQLREDFSTHIVCEITYGVPQPDERQGLKAAGA